MNVGKIIVNIIMIVITLGVLVGMYPTFTAYVDNATDSGFAGVAILTIAKTLYWLISSAVIILEMIVGFGLMELVRMTQRMKWFSCHKGHNSRSGA